MPHPPAQPARNRQLYASDWFTQHRENFKTPNIIYTNANHTLNALKQKDETWTAKTIEPVFRELMFEGYS